MFGRSDIFRRGEGRIYSLGRLTLAFKSTPPTYSLCEGSGPPGSGATLHRHSTYDEMHIVIEGHCEVQLDGKKAILGPGDMLFVPRRAIHGLTTLGPEPGRQLIISTPAGVFEAFVSETSAAQASGINPLTDDGKAAMRAIASKHGLEFVTP